MHDRARGPGRRRLPWRHDDEAVHALRDEPGLTAWGAQDGREALGMCGGVVPDAVLTDLAMPKVDGWELVAIHTNAQGGLVAFLKKPKGA